MSITENDENTTPADIKRVKSHTHYDKNSNETTENVITSIQPTTYFGEYNGNFYQQELDHLLLAQSHFILEAQKVQNSVKPRDGHLAHQKSLPLKTRRTPEYTVVLDLDETLVHASLSRLPDTDLTFEVAMPDTTIYTVFVKQRPGLMDFLKSCADKYELVLFTASKKIYADKLISLLDPEKKYIRHRMYREHCRQIMLNYVKDLSVLGRDLRKTIIVDNSPQAFCYQIDNGIPIRSWFGHNSRDTELKTLKRILDNVTSNTDIDIRNTLREKFHIRQRIEKFKNSSSQEINY